MTEPTLAATLLDMLPFVVGFFVGCLGVAVAIRMNR